MFYFLLQHALLLAAATLLLALPSLSLTVQHADGVFHNWRLSSLASHPNKSVVYVLDNNQWIGAVDSETGALLSYKASLSDSGNLYWTNLAVDSSGKRVYVIDRQRYSPNYVYNCSAVTLSADLAPLSNVSLSSVLSPPLSTADNVVGTPLVGATGLVYVVRRLSNYTLRVNVVSPVGTLLNTWLQPWRISRVTLYRSAVGPNDSLYFIPAAPQWEYDTPPVFVTSGSGGLLSSFSLNITYLDCYAYHDVDAISVSSSGNIAVSSGNCVMLFDSGGQRVPSFEFQPSWAANKLFRALAFSGTDKVLAVEQYSASISVISASTGNVVAD